MPVYSSSLHGVSLSDALKEAAVHAPAERVVLATYEFVHSSMLTRALVVASFDNITATTEEGHTVEFIALAALQPEGFEESAEGAMPLKKLRLDGVSSEILTRLDAALLSLEPVEVIERLYVSDDLTGPAILPPARALLRSGSVNETSVTIDIGFGDPANQPFPRKVYTRTEYPGLAP